MRPNNTRKALLLFLFFLLHCSSPPSTRSCPQPQFSAGFILQPTLFLSFSSSLFSSISPTRMHVLSRVSFSTPPGVLPLFCKPVPFKVPVLFYCFYFALLCCIIRCQVRSPVFVTHTYARVYLKMILCCFSCVCVFMNSFSSML